MEITTNVDFEKICRICMKEGVMMSIFKVNISKKVMSVASVQVWPNDGLPSNICNRCSAKLHLSFQFKRQCEKSDAKLREILKLKTEKDGNSQQIVQEQPEKLEEISHQLAQAVQQNNCVYIECNPVLDVNNGFITEQNHIGYNNVQEPQMGVYTLQNVPQVYNNGGYPIPVYNNLQVQSQHNFIPQPQIISQPLTAVEDHEKITQKLIKKEQKSEDLTKQCVICKKLFETSTKLTRHMKTHATDQPYKCKVCNKQFSHSGNFKIHQRMHTDERPFKCVVCSKGCRQAQDLEKHMRTHTGEKPHKCHICPRAFSTSSNLIAHIRTHTGERPYVCCVCQKGFCQSNELTKHMRTHTGEKSHICEICHRGFNGSSTLIVHRRSHTGEKPYVCIVCNKGFAQSSCLAVHMKRHSNEKNFQCTNCDINFPTNAELKDHLASSHSGDKNKKIIANQEV